MEGVIYKLNGVIDSYNNICFRWETEDLSSADEDVPTDDISVSSSSSRNSKVTVVTPSSNLVEDDIIEDENDVSTQEVDIVKVHDR